MPRAASTGGLATLLRELAPKTERRLDEEEGGGDQTLGLSLVALLHVVAVVLGVLAAVFGREKGRWTNDSFLIGGEVPARVVAASTVYALSALMHAIFTFIDANFYLGTSISVTGTSLGLAIVAVGLGGALTLVAALAMTEQVYWYVLGSFSATCILLGTQTAAILTTLIGANTSLKSAISRSL
jgi:hypothetical protein